jgi:hypothetical protein
MDHRLELTVSSERLAICRLEAREPVPVWANGPGFVSVTRTSEELSVVAPEGRIPEGVRCERGWRSVSVKGPLDFATTGVMAALAVPLAEAGISLFAVSTFDTDYLLVRENELFGAIEALRGAGHKLNEGRSL